MKGQPNGRLGTTTAEAAAAQYALVEAVEDDGGDCSEDDGEGPVRTTG